MDLILFLIVAGVFWYGIRSIRAQLNTGADKNEAENELKKRIIRLERRMERLNERLDIFSSELWALKKNAGLPAEQQQAEPLAKPETVAKSAVTAPPLEPPTPPVIPQKPAPSWKDPLESSVQPDEALGSELPVMPVEPLLPVVIETPDQSVSAQPSPTPVDAGRELFTPTPETAGESPNVLSSAIFKESPEASPRSSAPADSGPVPPSAPVAEEKPFAFDWENFLGKKLFAWIGSFALFLSALFFVRYAIENDLVSLGMRLVLGFFVGAGSIAGGLWLKRYGYRQTVDGLCAAGLAILYAVFIAAHRLPVGDPFIGTAGTFSLLTLLTAGAFTLSVRLDSLFVAILALVGGFLVPPFVSTGHDNPLGLFAYVTLLDTGLAAVALRKQWGVLITLGAIGTMLMQAGWVFKFFEAAKAVTAWLVFAWFPLFFTVVGHLANKRGWDDPHIVRVARVFPLISMWISFYISSKIVSIQQPDTEISGPSLVYRPFAMGNGGLVMSLPYWFSALIGWQALRDAATAVFAKYAHVIVFLLTWNWTTYGFTPDAAGTAWVLFAAYPAFFFALWRLGLRSERDAPELSSSARWSGLLAFSFNLYQLFQQELGNSPAHIFSLTALLAVGLAWQAMKDESAGPFHFGSGLSSFTIIALWASMYALRDNMTAAYLAFLGFPLFFVGTSKLAAVRGRLDTNLKTAGRV
ncbi:MAG TPA: DUF2339 domain-containing protein, partial [Candidatus Ozemobacteraceae bacterium]|nr:DUF2339 domain-containing protein [Candidatus Ozemobacteraceae bacterium]